MEKSNEEILITLTNRDIQNYINEYTYLSMTDYLLEKEGKEPIHTKRLKELKDILGDLVDEEEDDDE